MKQENRKENKESTDTPSPNEEKRKSNYLFKLQFKRQLSLTIKNSR